MLYRNGVHVASKNNATGAIAVDENWAIGARGTGTQRFFTGTIDDVRIYDRALSAQEAEQLYLEGIPELVGLEIEGPGEVAENLQACYKAIAYYDGGPS